jgi:citrate synthase
MSKGFIYRGQMSTRITREDPLPGNPYVAGARFTWGYAHTDLLNHCGYVDTLLLLLRGELPGAHERRLLERLLVGLSNPGPNHPAVRAAMTAGLSKSNTEHLLPLGLLVGGEARQTAAAWTFLRDLPDTTGDMGGPGFGSVFGEADPLLAQLAEHLLETGPWPMLTRAHSLVEHMCPQNRGWRLAGLVAAAAHDLGLDARRAIALYQLALAPAIAAHGIEQTHHPITAGPMLDDRDYELL